MTRADLEAMIDAALALVGERGKAWKGDRTLDKWRKLQMAIRQLKDLLDRKEA